jgi:DNA-binding response OmpR family regulator
LKKILLVDDNEQDRMLYKRYLKPQPGDESLEIHEAASGEDALRLFAQLRPDCVLLDYNLHDTDGLTLLENLHHLGSPNSLCVVMITGGGSESLAVRVLNSGALDYLVKGHFDRDLLSKTVRHAIEKNEWRQYQGRYHGCKPPTSSWPAPMPTSTTLCTPPVTTYASRSTICWACLRKSDGWPLFLIRPTSN